MDEFELIRRFFVRGEPAADVLIPIGDDGAVLRPPSGKDLVTVMDTLVEGVHFPANISSLRSGDLGYRAVAVNLSDIAAMGAEPRWMTLALTLADADETWLAEFSRGLFDAAAEHAVQLVGGDTTSGEKLVVTVQISGLVDAGRAICRSGARQGDGIYVSGNVGDAAAGLHLLNHPAAGPPEARQYLQRRYWRPSARVALGRSLAGVASAAIDVSDGLYADLGKLLAASGVGAEIDLDKLPISAALQASFDIERQRRFALSGGDDYELCIAAGSGLPPGLLPEAGGVALTAIGTVTEAPGIVCRDNGKAVAFDDSGFRHFS